MAICKTFIYVVKFLTICRPIAVDMQGFAVNVRVLMEQSSVWMDGAGAYTDMGYLEASRFIYQLAPDISALECRSRSDEVGKYLLVRYICVNVFIISTSVSNSL